MRKSMARTTLERELVEIGVNVQPIVRSFCIGTVGIHGSQRSLYPDPLSLSSHLSLFLTAVANVTTCDIPLVEAASSSHEQRPSSQAASRMRSAPSLRMAQACFFSSNPCWTSVGPANLPLVGGLVSRPVLSRRLFKFSTSAHLSTSRCVFDQFPRTTDLFEQLGAEKG